MRRLTITLLLFTFNSFLIILYAQPAGSGTSKTSATEKYSSTDWVAMMRDRNVNIHEVQKAFYKWYKKNHTVDKDKPGATEGTEDEAYEAFKRWEWYNLSRQDVNGNRADPYKVATDYENYLLSGSTGRLSRAPFTPSATATWTYAGNTTVPTNSSTGNGGDGRVNRVRVMPGNNSIMFACAPSGGLWKTTNGGTSWSENTDQLGDLSTSDIAINPLNTNIMYLATGDGDGIQSIYPTPATIGVLKSYDGGNTWNATSLAYSLSTAGADYYSVNEILIDPADTSVILAATTFGIWRSANSGTTWTLCTGTGTGAATWFHSMEFEPSHSSIVYAATSNVISGIGANFYRSTNNGISWTRITSGLPTSTTAEGFEIGVSAADSNDVYVLACKSSDYSYLGLYLSTNDGVSFTSKSTTPDILGWDPGGASDGGQGWYTLSMAVSQTNIDSVWVGGVNIWASSNGGTSWHLNANWEGTPYVHADIHHIQFIPGTNSKGYVVGCDGGVFMTSNSGTNWTDLSHNLEIAQQYCVGPSATTAGAWITGWQDNGTNFSTTPWKQVYGGDGMDCFVDWSNNNNYFAETAEGAFVKSTNAGGAWSNAAGGITETGPWVTVWMQDPRTSTTLYSGFSNVWKSTNSGGAWSKISTWGGTGGISALAVDSANVSYIYAAQPTIIERTTNGGTSWSNITGTLPVSATVPISAIAVSSKTPSHIWVTLGGYSSGNKVFASTNSGTTWTNISSGLPNLPVNCVVSESGSPNGIYVGTDQGVYYHDTVLNNWVFYNTGLPLVMIADLKIYKPGKELIAATYGRGTWETPLYSNSSPCTLSATASTLTNINCYGGANGSVSASASGGTSPYTYSWSGGNTNSTATALSAGVYTITIRDNAGCSATASTVITQPASAVGISILSTANINCNSITGSITANTATGGISPYTYSWSPSGGTNLTASNLSTGTYTITVTDNHGCTAIASSVITQSQVLAVSASNTANNTSCTGANGSVSATPSGGTSPYTYSWSGGGTSSAKTGLSAGTYTITLTDKNGCTATSSAVVTQAATLSVSANVAVYPSCFGGANGSVSATPSGGTSPYSYSWTGGNTNSTLTAVSAGTYTITLKDNYGCTATASTVVTQPATALSMTIASTANINCSSITGSITANSATGGFPPYTYSWSPSGGTNLTASNLSAGTYTITVTDNHTCSAMASASITQSSPLSVIAITTTNNTNCAGNNNGSVSAAPSGGTSPYTYSWSGGSTTSSESFLSAGTYTITLTDKNNCTATASATITQPTLLGVSATIISYASCTASNNGSISANASGGVIPYTYSWTGGSTNSTLSGITAGTYTVTLKDNSGCAVSASAVITQPISPVGITILSTTNINCNSLSGIVSANTATGGTSPYTYSWFPAGGTNLTTTPLSAGTYTITTTDNHGCTATASATLTQIASLGVLAATTANNSSCTGANGSVSATPSGGTLPYTYSWTGGNTNSTESGLSSGTYTITLTDNAGCSVTAFTSITQSSSLTVTANTNSNVTCNNNNGSVSATPSGGTLPYTYSWNGGNTNSTISGLSAGTYTVIVTDWNGCYATASATISQSTSSIAITRNSVNNILCYGGNGSATANPASGGSAPYTYSWSPGGGTNLTTIPIGAGTFTITATDNNGCTATATATITQPSSPLGITILSVSNALCNGGTGIVTANAATGGTSPYTYSWTPGGGTNLTATVSAGMYTILVTDNNGCNARAVATITQPASGLGITISTITNVLCNGGNGTITANAATGGTVPYTYSWSPIGGTNLSAIVSAGTYTIIAMDNNGCTASASSFIAQPQTGLGITILTITNVLCSGGLGSITVNSATGGTIPYTYSWSGGGGTGITATVSAGTYTITATDNHGCTATASASITQSSSLGVSANTTTNNTSCVGANGSVSATPSGGTSPYTYSWTGGSTGSTATRLSAGTYTITLVDNNGCTATASASITQSSSLGVSANTTTNNTSCVGANGSVSATPSGGTSPYTYSWTGGSTNSTATGLSAGTYTITLVDNNGCTATASASITQSGSLSLSSSTLANVLCYGGANGQAEVIASGGSSPYTYSWSPNGGNSFMPGNLSAGIYSVTVTDINGCNGSSTATITQPAAIRDSVNITNPTCSATTGSATVGVKGGTSPYTYSWNPGSATTASVSGLSAGTYTITVKDGNACSSAVTATIVSSHGLSITAVIQNNVSCYGGTNGIAKAGVSGGVSPYTYSWSPGGSTTYIASNVSAGTYTVNITDKNGCNGSATAIVTQPAAALGGTASITYPNCVVTTGSANIGVSGGTPPYTYTWSPSVSTSSTVTGLTIRNYVVSLKDSHGCTTSLSFSITQPPVLRDSIITSATTEVTCGTSNSGGATVGVKYGTQPYTYSWTNGSSSARASGLSVGTYSVTVKDANSCTATATVTITQTAGLSITTIIQNNVSCNGGTNGIAKVSVSGGVSPYTYSWSPVSSTVYLASNLSAGTYTVSVTDKNGCNGSAMAIITQAAAIRDSMAYINNATCYGGTGSAGIGIKGGTSPYTYTWSPAVSTTATATGLTIRSYVVTIKDAHGCTASLSFSITQPFIVRDSIVKAATVNVLCNGSHTGSATVGVKYGTQPYTYSWNPASGSAATATGLSAGTYTVTVKDRCGNAVTATVSITQPNALRDSISSSSCTSGLITATVGVKGGVSPYTYSWSPNVNSTSRASGLSAGTCTITVKDKNGCSIVFTPVLSCGAAPVNVDNTNGSENECCPGTENIKLYPNPTTGQFTIQLSAAGEQSSVEIYNMLGRKVYSQYNIHNSTFNIDLSSQPNGIYLYRVVKEDGSLVGTGRIIMQK